MAYCVLPFIGLNIQIYVLIIQRTTCLLTLPYAVKTSRPRIIFFKELVQIYEIMQQYYVKANSVKSLF